MSAAMGVIANSPVAKRMCQCTQNRFRT
uniref:Uncharacterized protein n=1 Tax=Rhizophora mucronata TaxID=61149 RepID=A0A2P2P5R2_RHIMU